MRVTFTHAMCEKECVKTNYAWVVLIKKRRFRPQIRTPNARNKIGALAWNDWTTQADETMPKITFNRFHSLQNFTRV